MKYKSMLPLILATTIATSLFGCGNKVTSTGEVPNDTKNQQAIEDMKNGIEEGTEKVAEKVTEAGENIKYTAINFKDDIINGGHNLTESTDTLKDHFSGKETDYLLENDIIRVYEYDTADKLNEEVKTISSNGLTINGREVGYTTSPYYYTKNNSLIVYEGSNPTYVNYLNNLYGTPVIP